MAQRFALMTAAEWAEFQALGVHVDPTGVDQVIDEISPAAGYSLVAYDRTTGEVTAIVSGAGVVSLTPLDGDGALDSSKTFALPALTAGQALVFVLSASGPSTGAGGTITVPEPLASGYRGLANDGKASDRGKLVVYAYTYAQWVAAGSPASVTIASASSCYMTAIAGIVTPVANTFEVAFAATGDAPNIVPAGGTGNYAALVFATRTRNDSVLNSAPTGYSGLTGSDTGGAATNDAKMRTLWGAARVATGIAAENPDVFGLGSPAGAEGMTAIVLVG